MTKIEEIARAIGAERKKLVGKGLGAAKVHERLALAAVMAMRKATPEMYRRGENPPGSPRSYDSHAVWGAMIDAILSEAGER